MINKEMFYTVLVGYNIVFFTLSLIFWWVFARPKKTTFISPAPPQAPKHMKPIEAQFVLLKTLDARGLFATLLDWLKQGIITIEWGDPLHSTPYTYALAPNPILPETKYESILYKAIFMDGKRTKVTQEQLDFVLFKKWASVRRLIHKQFSVHSPLKLYTKMASYTNFLIFMGVCIGHTMMTSYYMFLYIESELWTVIILSCLLSMMFIAAASNTWLSIDKFLNKGITFRTDKRQTPLLRSANLVGASAAFAFSVLLNSVVAFIFTNSVLVFLTGMLYHLATATLIIRPRFSPIGEKFHVTLKDYQTYLIQEEKEHIEGWIQDYPKHVLDHLAFSVALGAYEGVFINTMIDMQRTLDRNPNDNKRRR